MHLAYNPQGRAPVQVSGKGHDTLLRGGDQVTSSNSITLRPVGASAIVTVGTSILTHVQSII
jgi:hypothetical protein